MALSSSLLASAWPLLSLDPGPQRWTSSCLKISRSWHAGALTSQLPPWQRCRSAAVDTATTIPPAEEGSKNLAQQCTYGNHNALWLASELQRLLSTQRNLGDGLVLTRGHWSWDVQELCHYQLRGTMQFCNTTKQYELFVPEVRGKLQLLSNASLHSVTTSVQILPRHPGGKPPARQDGYWRAYITRAGESTAMEVVVDIQSSSGKSLAELQAVRVEMEYVSYGPHGRTFHCQHVILPLHYPAVSSRAARWRKVERIGMILPIATHLLSHLDDPLQVLRTYVLQHARVGDVIAIGETPLAIMQGRFRHPQGVNPGVLARLVCRLFHPTSSLATACGIQALVDVSGRLRVVAAVIFAVIARLVGIRGMFYRLAGEQARLIDDVTGTLPPYDQYICLGPVRVQETVDALKAKTGCEVAIVDVNDLKKVQILAASNGVDHKALEAALLDNPAGNADEQTPLVLFRKAATASDW